MIEFAMMCFAGSAVAALLALNEWASERRWERVCLIERIRLAKWRA